MCRFLFGEEKVGFPLGRGFPIQEKSILIPMEVIHRLVEVGFLFSLFSANWRIHCGSGRIRTSDTLSGILLFESSAFSHSATLP